MKNNPDDPSLKNNDSEPVRGGFNPQSNSNSFSFTLPQIELPKAGSIKGIEEKFAANPVTGSASLSVAFPVSPARSGFSPAIGISYDSSGGNSAFGFGWQINLPTIKRKTEKGIPRYFDDVETDTFLMSQSEDLVVSTDANGEIIRINFNENGKNYEIRRYRPRIEGSFSRIERWKEINTGVSHWRATTADNVTTIFGSNNSSQIVNPINQAQVFEWLPEITFDDKGNCILFEYKKEDLADVVNEVFEKNRINNVAKLDNNYLKKIIYGNRTPYHRGQNRPDLRDFLFEIVLDYGEHHATKPQPNDNNTWIARKDAFSTCRSGFEIRTYRLCRRVMLFHKFSELGYNPINDTNACLVSDVRFEPDTTISGFTFIKSIRQTGYKKQNDGTYVSKPLPDLELTYQRHEWNTEVKNISLEDSTSAPIGLQSRFQWIDYESNGLTGLLVEQSDGWYYKKNLGEAHFGQTQPIAEKPVSGKSPGQKFSFHELNADSQKYLVSFDNPKGFFELDDNNRWQGFKSFKNLPNIDFNNQNVRFFDIDGDGIADLVMDNDNVFTWYKSEGTEGFVQGESSPKAFDEEVGVRVVFADKEQKIFLADMTGDGLTDIVRIKNGEIVYWQNMGYGKFGAKVTMSDAPVFSTSEGEFNPKFVILADLDGSGTTDLIYTGNDAFQIWLNLNGNEWSNEKQNIINPFPKIDGFTKIDLIDLLGNGTQCIVWSSPLAQHSQAPMRYIDLLKSKKPNLLISYKNNMGKEVFFEYTASTKFYLDSLKTPNPWVTKLPFVVHCLSKTISRDYIAETRFVSQYEYHHGYYDKKEREFRGFGKVIQTDTELYKDFVVGTTAAGADGKISTEQEFYQPPVISISWYHTGAFINHEDLLESYRKEYFQQKRYISPNIFPSDISVEDTIECYRALKGVPIRQEIYSFDGSPNEQNPYKVNEHGFKINLLQSKNTQKHAVVDIHILESISVEFERDITDPRISHSFTLEVDDFLNVRKAASVVYGRKVADMALPPDVRNQQLKTYITYAETDYTNNVITNIPNTPYRLKGASESRMYEATGVSPAFGDLFVFNDLITIHLAAEIAYETNPNPAIPQKRLIAKNRLYYRKDDFSGRLPLHQMESLGIGFRSYALAFSANEINAYYGGNIIQSDLVNNGYENSEGDSDWWIPSGIQIFPANPSQHFYLPSAIEDALGAITTIKYDNYELLPVSTKDLLDNETIVTIDYRTLSPVMLTDPNKNRVAVETDALGMVTKTAIMGKVDGEADMLADPTTQIDYDLFNWQNNAKPNFLHTRAREKHGAGNPRWQESYNYFDGSGGLAMIKIQAAAGIAKKKQADGTIIDVDTTPNLRWIGNGKTILNNKGNPVKKYEPFFSVTHEYENEQALVGVGITPLLYYDAVGRNIKIVSPDKTFSKVEFNSWMTRAFDKNDTVKSSDWFINFGSPDALLIPEPSIPQTRAAWLASKHDNTPAVVHTDSLGRSVYGIADNASKGKYTSYAEADLTGRTFKIKDAKNRVVAEGFKSRLGVPVLTITAEKGESRTFVDILGNATKTWDSAGNVFRSEYDILHRPVGTYFQKTGKPEVLFAYGVYGEIVPNAEDFNFRGRSIMSFDQAGATWTESFDFKGIPLKVYQKITSAYKTMTDWSLLHGVNDINQIKTNADTLLINEVFSSSATVDALGRPILVTLPDLTELHPIFNESNFMKSLGLKIRGQGSIIPFLINQDYDAKGQRLFAQFGNNTITKYRYEDLTYRLSRLFTARTSDNALLQDLNYTYDPVGNITEWIDNAQQTLFYNNAVVSPNCKFEYDAVYRLIKATGREQLTGNNSTRIDTDIPFNPLPHANNATAVRRYLETYEYDELGNILEMKHVADSGSWTRNYRYAYQFDPTNKTNRLIDHKNTGDALDPVAPYTYDAHGNMLKMPHLSAMHWNHLDQLQSVDLGGGGTAYYVYSMSGGRSRKVIERQGGKRIERIYLGSIELYREWQGNTLELERQTIHVADNTGRIAQIDTKTIDTTDANGINTPVIRYYYSNHLGSTSLVTDKDGKLISYEEYHPYGTTAYRSGISLAEVSLKRYRFSGKERDDETGLYYFGARYYASWLGRWTSTDPAGFIHGVNLYRYCNNNPVIFKDPDGKDEIPFTEHDRLTKESTYDQRIAFANRHRRTYYEDENHVAKWDDAIGWSGGVLGPANSYTPSSQTGEAQNGDGGESQSGSSPDIPPRPAIQPGSPPTTGIPDPPIPPLDITEAPSGTDFEAEESRARSQYRDANGITGRDTAVQHPQKWRDGARTNTHPRITNHPRFLHPISNRRGTGGVGDNGRQYATQHTLADRGRYPSEVDSVGRRYGRLITDRVKTLWAGQNVRQRTTGSRGPLFLREYNFGKVAGGFAGALGLGLARNFVPLFAEAEVAIQSVGMWAVGNGIGAGTIVGDVALAAATAPAAVAGTALAAAAGGYIVGDFVENVVTDATGSRTAGVAAGTGAGALAGAGIGAAIGSVVPVVGTAVGAVVGAIAGGIAGFIGSFW